jgi:hypothetical protein
MWEKKAKPWNFPWKSIEFHGISLNFMKLRLTEFHGKLWKIPWNIVN